MIDINMLKESSGDILDVVVTTTESLLGGKKNPMKDKITKKVRGTVLFGKAGLYKELLSEAYAEAGEEFDSSKPLKKTWGEREGDSCIITNKGNYYVELFWIDSDTPEYFLDGEPIDKDNIEGLKPKRPTPKNESLGVVIRRYKAEGVELLG